MKNTQVEGFFESPATGYCGCPKVCQLGALGWPAASLADLERAGWQPAGLVKLMPDISSTLCLHS